MHHKSNTFIEFTRAIMKNHTHKDKFRSFLKADLCRSAKNILTCHIFSSQNYDDSQTMRVTLKS